MKFITDTIIIVCSISMYLLDIIERLFVQLFIESFRCMFRLTRERLQLQSQLQLPSTPLLVSCLLHRCIRLDEKVLVYGIELRPRSPCYCSVKETRVLDMTGTSVVLKPLKAVTAAAANDTTHCFCNDTPFVVHFERPVHFSTIEFIGLRVNNHTTKKINVKLYTDEFDSKSFIETSVSPDKFMICNTNALVK